MKSKISFKSDQALDVLYASCQSNRVAGIVTCALALFVTELLKSTYAGQDVSKANQSVGEDLPLLSAVILQLSDQAAIDAIITKPQANQEVLYVVDSSDPEAPDKVLFAKFLESEAVTSRSSILVSDVSEAENRSETDYSLLWLGLGMLAVSGGIAFSMWKEGQDALELIILSFLLLFPSFNNEAQAYDHKNLELSYHMPLDDFKITPANEAISIVPQTANDLWGYSDGLKEYAILGLNNGTAIVDVTHPDSPVYMAFIDTRNPKYVEHSAHDEPGELPQEAPSKACHHPEGGCEGQNSARTDLKCNGPFCYRVSEEVGHGLLVINMETLITTAQQHLENHMTPLFVDNTSEGSDKIISYTNDFGHAHNLMINEESNSLYVVGATTITNCDDVSSAGLIRYDLTGENAAAPKLIDCYIGTPEHPNTYYHDLTTEIYHGPDSAYTNHEIIIAAGGEIDEEKQQYIVILDAGELSGNTTNKVPITELATIVDDDHFVYVHQGDFSADQTFYFHDDESDEATKGVGTTTFVYDIQDLKHPSKASYFVRSDDTAFDHNQYVVGDCVVQSNYSSGVLVYPETLFTSGFTAGKTVATSKADLLAYFDTTPGEAGDGWNGSWSNYSYFADEKGMILASDIYGGLFILELSEDVLADCNLG